MTTSEPKRIYPSSAAFMVGSQVKTKSNKSCLRYQWAVAHSGLSKAELHQDIAAEYAGLGALDEFRYSAILDKEKVAYEREKPFKIEYKDCIISGRMDFDRADGIVVEKKSTTSQYMLKDHILTGEPDPGHAAQLVSYLAFLKREEGHLVTSYYEMNEDRNGYEVVAERKWVFKLCAGGDLTLDSTVYTHSVKDLARWYAQMQVVLSDPWTLPPKPMQSAVPYKSPCHYCPLKAVCATQDNLGTDVAVYLESAKVALVLKPEPRGFKIEHNSARRKKNRQDKKEKENG